MELDTGFAKGSSAQLKLELGAEFISRIQNILSLLKGNPQYASSARLPKQVVVRTRGCRIGNGDLAVLKRAAEIAISQAADSVSAQNGLAKDQFLQKLWPSTDLINVIMTFTPPDRFGFDLDLDE